MCAPTICKIFNLKFDNALSNDKRHARRKYIELFYDNFVGGKRYFEIEEEMRFTRVDEIVIQFRSFRCCNGSLELQSSREIFLEQFVTFTLVVKCIKVGASSLCLSVLAWRELLFRVGRTHPFHSEKECGCWLWS